MLEMLVHLEKSSILSAYSAAKIEFDEEKIEICDPHSLPQNWREPVAPRELKSIGEEWLRSGRSAILQVPSAITPQEHNYRLNPLHPEFPSLRIGPFEPVLIDERLLK